MTLQNAVQLISHPKITKDRPQHWADLGCGDGLFSKALLEILHPFSVITAIDLHKRTFADNRINFLQLDFTLGELPLANLDGIILANSLHFARHQSAVLENLKTYLKPEAPVIIVEYDNSKPNHYVPYPLDLKHAFSLFNGAGFTLFEKINETPSVFHQNFIYSAIATML